MHSLFAQLPPVDVLHDEYERLADVICASPRATDALALLWSELSRAAIISPVRAPDDLIRMNSVVRYTDLMTGGRRTVQLVYADKEHFQPGDVPITTNLGAALIGLRPGAMFSWTEEDEPRAIRIDAVEPMAPAPARSGRRRRRGARAAEQPGTSSAALHRRVTVHIRPRRRSAMQSAPGQRGWVLSFEPIIGLAPDPLMGWTTTSDPLAGHEMNFRKGLRSSSPSVRAGLIGWWRGATTSRF
jgi:regulator of nucleoside diphosphate kinase